MKKRKFITSGILATTLLLGSLNIGVTPTSASSTVPTLTKFTETEDNDTIEKADVTPALKPSYYGKDLQELSIKGNLDLTLGKDYFKIPLPKNERGLPYVTDRLDTVHPYMHLVMPDGKVLESYSDADLKAATHLLISVSGRGFNAGMPYDIRVEFRANPADGNPHEPNDTFDTDKDYYEYAFIKNNTLTSSTWSTPYDLTDNFAIDVKGNKGKLTVELHHTEEEYQHYKSIESYRSYDIFAEKKDGSFILIGGYFTWGMEKVEKVVLNVNNSNFTGVYVMRHSQARPSETFPNYKVKMNFVSDQTDTINPKVSVERLSGSSRYSTNIAVLEKLKEKSVSNVVVASGESYPDALAGGFLLKNQDAALVLVNSSSSTVNNATSQIKRIMETGGKVYILGGTSVVPKSVEDSFKKSGLKVERIAGSSRVTTSIKVAEKEAVSESDEIFLAYGYSFADALSVSPVSAKLEKPIILNDKKDSLNSNIVTYIKSRKISKATIIGGTAVQTKAVEDALKKLGVSVDRIAGSNRYDTSLKIAQKYYPKAEGIVLTNGENFPDALSSTNISYYNDMPTVLVQPKQAPSSTRSWMKEREKDTLDKYYLIGGTAVLSEDVTK